VMQDLPLIAGESCGKNIVGIQTLTKPVLKVLQYNNCKEFKYTFLKATFFLKEIEVL
jgi:hypothetical protein